MANLLCGDLSPDALLVAIDQLSECMTDGVHLVLSPASSWLDRHPPDPDLIRSSSEGRIFGPTGEFRWRRIGDRFRCVYLGQGGGIGELEDHTSLLSGLTRDHSRFFLWGVRSESSGEWQDRLVPKRFLYPVTTGQETGGRVQLQVEHWLDMAGVPRFSRYHSLHQTGGEHAEI